MAHSLFGGKSPKALPWHPIAYMDEFLMQLEADDYGENYIRCVKVGLAHFGTFCQGEKISHPDELERTHILRFQLYLQQLTKDDGQPFAQSYRQQLLKYVRTWVNWCVDCDYITTSPWVRIRVGSTPKKPKPLEDDEVAGLFGAHRAQAFSIPPFSFHRREVMLVLLFGWGLRIHELESLTVTQMDVRQESVRVRNKGGGSKVLPYSDAMKQVVSRWLVVRAGKSKVGDDHLLVTNGGEPLTTHMMRKIVTELGDRAGVAINPHRLRDTYATTLMDNDVPIEQIMLLLGHRQRSQTLAYAKIRDAKLVQSHDRAMNGLLTQLLQGA